MSPDGDIAIVAPEALPFSKAGGLGDVVPALARALARRGLRVRLFLPHNPPPGGAAAGPPLSEAGEKPVPLGPETETARFLEATLPGTGIETVLVSSDRFFPREGIYVDPDTGEGYPDNALRFAFFQRAVLESLRDRAERPGVIHVHDHPCALLPLMLRHDPTHPCHASATVLTLHNLGYQGVYPRKVLSFLGLPDTLALPYGPLEYYGSVNFLKAGIFAADLVTTVSPRYAREIQTPEFGCGLDGVLRARGAGVVGILNGADYERWDPATDRHLPANYGPEDLSGKAACRRALLEELRLGPATEQTAILGFVGRLVRQKGLPLILDVLDRLGEDDVRFVVLGTGEKEIEARFTAAARAAPGRVAAAIRYDEGLAHRLTAGADAVLMPSLYEPCGLNQLYALRYGALPIVRETGGLADTVRDVDDDPDAGDGFLFSQPLARELLGAVLRALTLRARRAASWEAAVRRAMREVFSWDLAASRYMDAYRLAASRHWRGP